MDIATPEGRDELREMNAQVPAGPWITNEHEFGRTGNPTAVLTLDPEGLLMSGSGGARSWSPQICRSSGVDASPEIMRFIAATREALPAALDRIDAQDAEIARLRAALEDAGRAGRTALETELWAIIDRDGFAGIVPSDIHDAVNRLTMNALVP